MQAIRTAFLAVLLAGVVTGIGHAQEEKQGGACTSVAESTLDLGVDLYRALRKSPGNLAVSPYTISTALSMLRAGARGETAEEIDKVLHFRPGDSLAGHRTLRKRLRPGPAKRGRLLVDAFTLDLASPVWLAKEIEVTEEYHRLIQRECETRVERFSCARPEEARRRIDDRVRRDTTGGIQHVVPPHLPQSDTALLLVSTVYFKARWAAAFGRRRTREGRFSQTPDRSSPVHFMRKVATFAYAEDENWQVVDLPFLAGETSMVVALPRRRFGLPEAEKRISSESIRRWLSNLELRPVELELPRFRFTHAVSDLSGVLRGLGLKRTFTPEADFTGISEIKPLFASDVLHQTLVSVDEDGVEAAATTLVAVSRGRRAGPTDPVKFVADHPFIFFIRHVKTGTVLFIGRVHRPE